MRVMFSSRRFLEGFFAMLLFLFFALVVVAY